MCIVSLVIDQGREVWPGPYTSPPQPYTFPVQPWQPVERIPTAEEWEAFLELVEKAKKFDEVTGQPDCEDPEKVEWMRAVERRLDELERSKPKTKKRTVKGQA